MKEGDIKRKKGRPPVKKSSWRSFSAEDYRQAAVEMVHFSAKTVNSNTIPFGIRLSADMKLNLPFIAASLMDRTDIPLDYSMNVGKTATMVKQINAVRLEACSQFESPPPQADIDVIQACGSMLDAGYEAEYPVGVRLRQIILQDSGGNDVAATPLPCAGLSVLINKRIIEEFNRENPMDDTGSRKNEKNFISRERSYLGFGGSNPQNVGLNVRAMQKPMMFKVPIMSAQSRDLKLALAAHHNGLRKGQRDLPINTTILREFILWQEKLLARHFKIQPTDLETRNKEAEFLTAIANDLMSRAAEIEELLRDIIERLPDERMFSPDLSFLQQALLDSSLRTMEWRREFADLLHSQIIGEYVWINNQEKALKGNKQETASWLRIIEDALK